MIYLSIHWYEPSFLALFSITYKKGESPVVHYVSIFGGIMKISNIAELPIISILNYIMDIHRDGIEIKTQTSLENMLPNALLISLPRIQSLLPLLHSIVAHSNHEIGKANTQNILASFSKYFVVFIINIIFGHMFP